MNKAIAITYTKTVENRIHIIRALLAGCMFLAVLYALNVYLVVSRTVTLQKIDSKTSSLATSVDALDTKYLELSSAITPDNLAKMNLSEGHVSQYISRASAIGRANPGSHEL